MRESDAEGLATRGGPESCAGAREGAGEALAGGVQARLLSREIRETGVPTLSDARKATPRVALAVQPKRQTDPCRPCTPSRGPASAVLAHPRRVGSLRSSAQTHDLGHLADKSLASLSGRTASASHPRTPRGQRTRACTQAPCARTGRAHRRPRPDQARAARGRLRPQARDERRWAVGQSRSTCEVGEQACARRRAYPSGRGVGGGKGAGQGEHGECSALRTRSRHPRASGARPCA